MPSELQLGDPSGGCGWEVVYRNSWQSPSPRRAGTMYTTASKSVRILLHGRFRAYPIAPGGPQRGLLDLLHSRNFNDPFFLKHSVCSPYEALLFCPSSPPPQLFPWCHHNHLFCGSSSCFEVLWRLYHNSYNTYTQTDTFAPTIPTLASLLLLLLTTTAFLPLVLLYQSLWRLCSSCSKEEIMEIRTSYAQDIGRPFYGELELLDSLFSGWEALSGRLLKTHWYTCFDSRYFWIHDYNKNLLSDFCVWVLFVSKFCQHIGGFWRSE